MIARPLCPTEKLMRILHLKPRHVIVISFALLPALSLLHQYGFLDSRNTLVYLTGFTIVANLVFGFQYYGDRIARAAEVIERAGCGNSQHFLATVYSVKRLYSAISVTPLGPMLILFYVKGLPLLHLLLWLIGSGGIGFMVGDATSGTLLYSLAVSKFIVANDNCRILGRLRKLGIVITTALGLLFHGAVLTLLVIVVLPHVFVALGKDIMGVELLGLSIVTPALFLVYFYPIQGMWTKAIRERNEKLERLEDQIYMMMQQLEKLINENNTSNADDAISMGHEVENLIKQVEAMRVLQEYYSGIRTLPLTGSQVVETITTLMVPWLSLIVEVVKDLVLSIK